MLFLVSGMLSITAMSQKGRISDSEREFLENNYWTTTKLLESTLEGLSEADWKRRPASGGWSVAETMEHIILAMPAQLKGLQKALASESDQQVDLSSRDGWLLSKIADRGVKVKTPLEPEGAAMTKAEMLKVYQENGERFLEILSDRKTAFRHFYGQSPYGEVDAYQLMIFIPGHIQRHLSQIEEILRGFRS